MQHCPVYCSDPALCFGAEPQSEEQQNTRASLLKEHSCRSTKSYRHSTGGGSGDGVAMVKALEEGRHPCASVVALARKHYYDDTML